MILDSSAVVAVVLREPGFEELIDRLDAASVAGIGAPTLAEAGVVLAARLGRDPRGILARLLQEMEIETVPFGEAHWQETVEAYRRFGKGKHPASLNFGDCMAYATAQLAEQPLLCTGREFGKTDLELA